MGLQSTMTTSLTGLQAAETTIDVVGNNVANSSTVGFKESDVLFATQFLQTQSIGSAPTANRGGTNPRQIGLGVTVATINPDFTQGTIEISSNPLDVAIQGDGFLIVQTGDGRNAYTRNGQLQTNAENDIVTASGNRVLGYGVDENFNIVENLVPLTIPLGGAPVAQATENVFMSGVLTPEADVGNRPAIIASQVLGNASIAFPDDENFNISDFEILDPPVVTTATASAGAGALPANTYAYRIVHYTPDGNEGPPSEVFGTTTLGAPGGVQLNNLPVDGTGQWAGRRIYRQDGGTGDFQLVADIADETTTSLLDNNAAPGAALSSDSLNLGAFSYYVAWTDASGSFESRPTPLIGTFAISELGRRIIIENIPQPPSDSGFDRVKIYRNSAISPGRHFEVATLPVGQDSFVDNVPDSALGSEIDLMGPKANSGTLLMNLVTRNGDNYSQPFADAATGATLSFTGRKGDRDVGTKTLEINNTTTVQDLINFMDQSLGIDNPTDLPPDPEFLVTPGGVMTSDGQLKFTSNMGIANALEIDLGAFTITPNGSTASKSVSLTFDETQSAVGAGSITDFVVYDSLGSALNVRLTTVLERKTDEATIYRWYATSPDNQPTSGVDTVLGNGTIEFDSNGAVVRQNGGTAQIAIQRATSAAATPLLFNIDFTQITGLDVKNSQGQSVSGVNLLRQDGFAPGTLTSFLITQTGLIRGVFSNGAERTLGQIRMVRFSNNPGLEQLGNNLFATGVNSGEPIEANPGDQGIGTLTAGAVELSNTDIGQNLIELILASTQYRGGARVITTAQELLDELLSLRR